MLSEVQKRKKETITLLICKAALLETEFNYSKTKEPIYDDVELSDKSSIIDLSKNIAYERTKK